MVKRKRRIFHLEKMTVYKREIIVGD